MRTALKEYIHDLFDFIDKRIEKADNDITIRDDALKSASGALEVIKYRIEIENKILNAQFELLELLNKTRELIGLSDKDYQSRVFKTKESYAAFRKAIQIARVEGMLLQSIDSDPWPDLGPIQYNT